MKKTKKMINLTLKSWWCDKKSNQWICHKNRMIVNEISFVKRFVIKSKYVSFWFHLFIGMGLNLRHIFSKKANKRTVHRHTGNDLYRSQWQLIGFGFILVYAFFFVCVYFIKICFTLYLNPNDTKQILNLCHFRSFFYTFTDRRRLEICLYGVGQDFPLGIFPCLCLRYHWHHFPESIIVWYTARCWQEVEWNTITEKQFYVANGYWTDDNWLK